MGMAASQARFLGLTARKNNVEFEGQQVNQQRTTLSNQSANYYNDLLGMSVPVPPSVDDYTKTVYTFQDGALTNQITSMMAQNDGTYVISYLRTWTNDFAMVSAATSIVNKKSSNEYCVGANTLRELASVSPWEKCTDEETQQFKYAYIDDQGKAVQVFLNGNDNKYYTDTGFKNEYKGNDVLRFILNPFPGTTIDEADDIILVEDFDPNPNDEIHDFRKYIGYSAKVGNDDAYLKELSEDQLASLMKEEAAYLAELQAKYGDGEYMVRYVKNTTTGEYEPYFYKKDDLDKANYDTNGNSQSNINCYTVGSQTETEEVKALKGVQIEKDSSGRYINITIPMYDANGVPDTTQNGITYALTTSTSTDQAAYEDAMNQYEFDKAEYDKAINDINSKIEIIQSQDKNLELRLKQLDTEQKAISTEIDSVSQVIQKNTESSFKTFG